MQLHDVDEEEEDMEGQTPAPRHFVTPKARRGSSGGHLHIPVDFFRWIPQKPEPSILYDDELYVYAYEKPSSPELKTIKYIH